MQSDPLPADLADAFARVGPQLGKLGSPVLYFSTVGSTNDVAMRLAAAGAGAVVVADTQTVGRGRRGRHWFSPPLSGLYVSVVLDLPGDERPLGADGQFLSRGRALLTLAAGVALAEGIEAVTGLRVEIKWPNDLLVGSRKLAGILAEAATPQTVVLGYGINVGAMAYPPNLADRATSLESELGRPIDRAQLCVETLVCVARWHAHLEAGRFDAILDAWRLRAPGSVGRRVAWETTSGSLSGMTAGIDQSGALLVTVGNRVERLFAGEVTWV